MFMLWNVDYSTRFFANFRCRTAVDSIHSLLNELATAWSVRCPDRNDCTKGERIPSRVKVTASRDRRGFVYGLPRNQCSEEEPGASRGSTRTGRGREA